MRRSPVTACGTGGKFLAGTSDAAPGGEGMEVLVLALAAVVVIVILVGAARPPRNANHAGLRFEVRQEVDPEGSGGRRDIPSLPLQVLDKDRAHVDGERHALALR